MLTSDRHSRSVRGRLQKIKGSTLFELLIVLVVLATLAGLVTAAFNDPEHDPERTATHTTMVACREAILGGSSASGNAVPGFVSDLGMPPDSIRDLLRKPQGAPLYDLDRKRGWRGPYVRVPQAVYEVDPLKGFTTTYSAPGDPAIADGWQSPIVLQYPDPNGDGVVDLEDAKHVRLISAGPDQVLDTPRFDPSGTVDVYFPSLAACDDDLVLYLHVADLRQ